MIKETENDDLTNVMQELIETYADQMGEVAVNLCQELVSEESYHSQIFDIYIYFFCKKSHVFFPAKITVVRLGAL